VTRHGLHLVRTDPRKCGGVSHGNCKTAIRRVRFRPAPRSAITTYAADCMRRGRGWQHKWQHLTRNRPAVAVGPLFSCAQHGPLTRRWKSSGELVATTRANRRAMTAREAPKEAASETCGVTNRNRMGGEGNHGQRANDREALATKETTRRSGTRAGTANESYLGRSRLTSERTTPVARSCRGRSQKSAAAIVAEGFG
jgi:hypothetical protein